MNNPFLSRFTFWVGNRFLQSKKSDKYLSFVTLISVLGIGIGVTALIVVMSVMDGFEQEQKARLMDFQSHVWIEPTQKTEGFEQGFVHEDLFHSESFESWVNGSGPVSEKELVITSEVMVRVGSKVTGVELRGISESGIKRLEKNVFESIDLQAIDAEKRSRIVEGSALKLWMGRELAFELGVVVGDEVILISPVDQYGDVATGVPLLRKFIIIGIYDAGGAQRELQQVITDHRSFRNFVRKQSIISRLELRYQQMDLVPKYVEKLRNGELFASGEWKVKSYMDLNRQLFASLKLERVAMFIALSFIVVVASFNIVCTLSLMVIKKRKEISILKAMGASHTQVAGMFMAEGLTIGGLGVLGGVLVALIISILLKRYDFIELPDVYYDRTLPVTMSITYYLGVAFTALMVVGLACWYPCSRALKYDPIEGIRRG